jgi:hypothetical protein
VSAQRERERLNAAELRERLRARYAPPAWALFEEVSNGTGGYHRRSADALAMSLWPSRGLEILGFEIKASRADWMRERDDPAKAEEIASRCDRWWLVVGDVELVHDGELPPSWGLLVPDGKGSLRTKVEAVKLEAKELTRPFVAAILRRAHESLREMIPKSDIQAAIAAACDEREEKVRRDLAAGDTLAREFEELRERIAKFETASGVTLDRWSAGNIGEAVRVLLAGDVPRHRFMLRHLRDLLKRDAATLDHALKELDKIAPGEPGSPVGEGD